MCDSRTLLRPPWVLCFFFYNPYFYSEIQTRDYCRQARKLPQNATVRPHKFGKWIDRRASRRVDKVTGDGRKTHTVFDKVFDMTIESGLRYQRHLL